MVVHKQVYVVVRLNGESVIFDLGLDLYSQIFSVFSLFCGIEIKHEHQ